MPHRADPQALEECVSVSVHNDTDDETRGEALHVEAAAEELVLRCRICMDEVNLADGSSVILDCSCRGELAGALARFWCGPRSVCSPLHPAVHLSCSKEWFSRRGNMTCEICCELVSNVPGCVLRAPEPIQVAGSARGRTTTRRGRRLRRNASRGPSHPAELASAIRVSVPLSCILAISLTTFFNVGLGLDMLTSISVALLGSVLFCIAAVNSAVADQVEGRFPTEKAHIRSLLICTAVMLAWVFAATEVINQQAPELPAWKSALAGTLVAVVLTTFALRHISITAFWYQLLCVRCGSAPRAAGQEQGVAVAAAVAVLEPQQQPQLPPPAPMEPPSLSVPSAPPEPAILRNGAFVVAITE
jgi:hypothetical protein